jgi:hypothetical protein
MPVALKSTPAAPAEPVAPKTMPIMSEVPARKSVLAAPRLPIPSAGDYSSHPTFDLQGPTTELLVGGPVMLPGLTASSAVLFWRADLVQCQVMADTANANLKFLLAMYNKVFGHALALSEAQPPPLKCIWIEEKSDLKDKGKAQAEPMDKDEDDLA